MISLLQIKSYLQQRHSANLLDMATHFDADQEMIKSMLDHWIRKGYVSVQKKTDSCGSRCQQCSEWITEIYQWQDQHNLAV